MIITKQKPLDEIISYVKNYDKILITGCDGCYQPPRSEKESEILGLLLQLKDRLTFVKNSHKIRAMTVLRQCDDKILSSTMRPILKEFQPDAIISMACGAGVQTNAQLFDIPVFPGQNTMFIGAELHQNNQFLELCEACGDCMLGETGGICPVVNCAKHLMNGPCGGTVAGMCEVGNYSKPCAWVEIWKKLKRQGKLNVFKKFRMPRDYRASTSPRDESIKLSFEDVAGSLIETDHQQETKEVAEIE